jgi:hypothetical protein
MICLSVNTTPKSTDWFYNASKVGEGTLITATYDYKS